MAERVRLACAVLAAALMLAGVLTGQGGLALCGLAAGGVGAVVMLASERGRR